MTLALYRSISDALARPVPPARREEQRSYRVPSFIDPHDLPVVRELFGLEALYAWAESGGDATIFRRQ